MTKIINNEHVFILAEVAQSYEGDIDTLVQIAQKACLAGVDGVMFQVVFADELTVPEHACYNLFQSLEMPNESWKKESHKISKDILIYTPKNKRVSLLLKKIVGKY